MSFEKLRNFFEGRSAPLLTHLKTYQGTAEKVHDVSMQAASIVMKEAGKAVRKVQVEALAVASKSSAACPYQLVLTKEIGKELVLGRLCLCLQSLCTHFQRLFRRLFKRDRVEKVKKRHPDEVA